MYILALILFLNSLEESCFAFFNKWNNWVYIKITSCFMMYALMKVLNNYNNGLKVTMDKRNETILSLKSSKTLQVYQKCIDHKGINL